MRLLYKLKGRSTAPEAKESIFIMARWKDIAGYEGLYQVSDDGRVKSLPREKCNGRGCYRTKERILRPGKRGRDGLLYQFVVLSDGETVSHHSVHRLVADAFLENQEMFPEVNHKDKNTMNNCASNLEWCTRGYNINYSKAKRVSQFNNCGEKLAEYQSIVVASEITGISRTAINNNLKNWSKTAGGYIWKYEQEE